MDFSRSAVAEAYLRRLSEFMDSEVMPAETEYKQQLNGGGDWRQWRQPAIMESLKARARELGLWNLFCMKARAKALVLLCLMGLFMLLIQSFKTV